MFKDLSILQSDDDTKYTFSEWDECPDLLEITYLERDHQSNMYIEKFTLPVFNKEDWEEFKNAGDAAFILMEKSHV